MKVLGLDLPGLNMIDVIAPFSRSGDRAGIGGLANVETVGTGRINANDLREACVIDQVAEYAFCAGRPANIAHAYEENFCHDGAYCEGKPATCLHIFLVLFKKTKKLNYKIFVLKQYLMGFIYKLNELLILMSCSLKQ